MSRKERIWPLALLLLGAAAPGSPNGKEIALHGNGNGAMPCAACHMPDGAGNPAIGAPALAGKDASKLLADLNRLAASQGSGMMPGIAAALSPDERQAVSTYFSTLPEH